MAEELELEIVTGAYVDPVAGIGKAVHAGNRRDMIANGDSREGVAASISERHSRRLPAFAAEAAAATAAGTLGLGTGFVDAQCPAVEVGAVQRGNRTIAFGIVRHFDKPESTRLSRIAIRNDVDATYGSMGLEQSSKRVFGSPKAEVSDKDILHVNFPLRFERLIWKVNDSSV
jgi:hypothetical protein